MVSGSKKVRHINSALDRSLLFNPGEGRALTIENMWSTKTQLMPNMKCKVNPFHIPLNSIVTYNGRKERNNAIKRPAKVRGQMENN